MNLPFVHNSRPPVLSNASNRYQSAPVGHVLRVAERTEPPKAAGAIISGFSSHVKLLVMARGARAVYTAAKAIASARFMAIRGGLGEDAGFDIAMQPVLQPDPRNTPELHQMRLYLYKVPVSSLSLSVQDKAEESNRRVMRVGATTDPRGLAGSITTTLLAEGVDECECLAAGFIPVYRAVRGVAIARHVMLRKNHPWTQSGDEGSMDQESEENEKYSNKEPRVRLRPFPHQGRQRARISAKDFGPKDRKAMDLMTFVGWRDYEDGKRCIALVFKACEPGQLEEAKEEIDNKQEDILVAPRI